MTDTPTPLPPASAAGVQRTFTLSAPLRHNDQTWATLTLPQPKLAHVVYGESKAKGATALAHQIGFMAGVPHEACLTLKTRDLRAIRTWFDELVRGNAAAGARVEIGHGEATFHLASPIVTDGKPIAALTVGEPDLASSVVAEKFADRPYLGTAAMVAHLSGQVVPVIQKMTMADLAAIEAWLAPFVSDTDSTEVGAT